VRRTRRTCPKGHEYWKSSDCPTCPVCEAARKPAAAFMEGLSAPARRALEGVGLTTLAKLSRKSESQVLELHGIGPSAIPKLRAALRKGGRKFAED
jgi:predicted RecB family nuclease